ncbi:MAG: hypothetical protein KFKLKKLM_00761 [Flavobacteriales bacterium]|nr:hypothetical protein [Flavobacteriales bacterium]
MVVNSNTKLAAAGIINIGVSLKKPKPMKVINMAISNMVALILFCRKIDFNIFKS